MLKVKKLKEGFSVVGHVEYNNVDAKVVEGKVSGKGSRKYKAEILKAIEEFTTPTPATIEEVEASTLEVVTTVDAFDKFGEYEGTHEVVTDGSEYAIKIENELHYPAPSIEKMIRFAFECDKYIFNTNDYYRTEYGEEWLTAKEIIENAPAHEKTEVAEAIFHGTEFENDETVVSFTKVSDDEIDQLASDLMELQNIEASEFAEELNAYFPKSVRLEVNETMDRLTVFINNKVIVVDTETFEGDDMIDYVSVTKVNVKENN